MTRYIFLLDEAFPGCAIQFSLPITHILRDGTVADLISCLAEVIVDVLNLLQLLTLTQSCLLGILLKFLVNEFSHLIREDMIDLFSGLVGRLG